jgi:DNA-directed RNA polymerase subunit RPC12/RpoP
MSEERAEETPDKDQNGGAEETDCPEEADGVEEAEPTKEAHDSPIEESELSNSELSEHSESDAESTEDDELLTQADEGQNCPSCGRAVAMKSRATCAYCGEELPWASATASEEQESPQLNIAELLGGSDLTRQMAAGVTYPVACGACGASLTEEEKPERCLGCRAMVRDPFTGKLIYGKETSATGMSAFRVIFFTLTLFACAGAAVYIFRLLSKISPN